MSKSIKAAIFLGHGFVDSTLGDVSSAISIRSSGK
jgi:hypothetical protein